MAILPEIFPVASKNHFLAFSQYRDTVAQTPHLRLDGCRMARFHMINVDRYIRTPEFAHFLLEKGWRQMLAGERQIE